MERITIGKVAAAAGVGVETVRFYERKGLLPQPSKPQRGFRCYPPDAVEQIRFIKQAQELGFTLSEAADLLSLRTDPKAECGTVRQQAEIKLADVNQKIERLETIRSALRELIAACPNRGPIQACSILDAMKSGTVGVRSPSPRTRTGKRARTK